MDRQLEAQTFAGQVGKKESVPRLRRGQLRNGRDTDRMPVKSGRRTSKSWGWKQEKIFTIKLKSLMIIHSMAKIRETSAVYPNSWVSFDKICQEGNLVMLTQSLKYIHPFWSNFASSHLLLDFASEMLFVILFLTGGKLG